MGLNIVTLDNIIENLVELSTAAVAALFSMVLSGVNEGTGT